MKTKKSLAIIIPVYNEIESLKHLVHEIHLSLKNYQNYSILFIDDGSTDGSFEFLKNIIKSDSKIHLIQFSINKGKSAALNEGFIKNSIELIVILVLGSATFALFELFGPILMIFTALFCSFYYVYSAYIIKM